MKNYVVAISIDKVQSFLYHVLQSPTQDSQSNSGTLSSIIHSSNKISEDFYKDIGLRGSHGPFSSHIRDELMVCSGTCIFTVNLSEEALLEKLDSLFKQYYLDNAGRLLLQYVYFDKDIRSNCDRLHAIKESKDRLRQKECLNKIIERNQEILFQFNEVPQGDVNPRKSTVEDLSKYEAFVKTINALYEEDTSDNDNRFRIAVIKADLDGMGELFKSIKDYNAYMAVSNLLSDVINLTSLHEITKKEQERDQAFKLYPLYLAGDDIFFAVPMSHLIRGVNICKLILLQLNIGIAKINEQFNLSLPKLSISVGVDFTYNREPIRYYYERVQRQVDGAKQNKLEGAMKVCISNYVFYDIHKDTNVEKAVKSLPKWHHFINEAQVLKGAIDEGFVANHFFYSLLNKITDPNIYKDDIKYSNAVLYHLLPQHLEASNTRLRKFELMLLQKLMAHLFVNQKGQHEIRITHDTRKQLETFVRLLLLFSDGRFQLVEKTKLVKNFNSEQVKGALFNKPLRYMYQQSLMSSLLRKRIDSKDNIADLRKVFVKSDTYNAPNVKKVDVYRTLKVSSSMFHRLKNTDKFDVVKAADMLQAVNVLSKDEIKELEKQRKNEKKAPPGLYFDADTFKSIANHTSLWNQDYIDTLLIFYQLKELSIRFRKMYPKYKKNKSNHSYKGKNKGSNKKNNQKKGARR